ncbi:MAG: hypothetical protein HYZ92_04650 [Candidatus Omnitrophica bacterium]|nr:hypothetical protein [Candidatus Omnitrophota bacterium]
MIGRELSTKEQQRLDKDLERLQDGPAFWQMNLLIVVITCVLSLLLYGMAQLRDQRIRRKVATLQAQRLTSLNEVHEKATGLACERQLAVCWNGHVQQADAFTQFAENFLSLSSGGRFNETVIVGLLFGTMLWSVQRTARNRRLSLLLWRQIKASGIASTEQKDG